MEKPVAVIPCQQSPRLKLLIEEFAEVLKTESHKLGSHGLTESEFYQSGLFNGAIQRIRGQNSASMGPKREFVRHVLAHMEDRGFIKEWESAGAKNRHDYKIVLPDDRIAAIELKGCLDGNNTNIFVRPNYAEEFVIWSVCTNSGCDPRRNVRSGIHTRLSSEIIKTNQAVDGLVVWDWLCGTLARPCPKLEQEDRKITVGPYKLVPPCIYLFPKTVPDPRNNPSPKPNTIESVGLLLALHKCFGGADADLNRVTFTAANRGADLVRTSTVERGGVIQMTSKPTPIRR